MARNEKLGNVHTSRYDGETQDVARYARQIQQQLPGVTWGECIRVAEERIAKEKGEEFFVFNDDGSFSDEFTEFAERYTNETQ